MRHDGCVRAASRESPATPAVSCLLYRTVLSAVYAYTAPLYLVLHYCVA